MKRVIRRNCFETNSSSMHSIVVTKYDRPYKSEELPWELRERNKIRIWDEHDLEFERYPFEILSDVEDKVRYAIASFCCYKDSEYCESFISDLEEKLREAYPGFEKIELPEEYHTIFHDQEGNELNVKNVHFDKYLDEDCEESQYYYLDKNGNKQIAVRTDETKPYPVYGYVDHQSQGLLQEFLNSEGISLIDFITNKKYIVIIDGDEYYFFDKAKESGLIDLESLVKEYPYSDKIRSCTF